MNASGMDLTHKCQHFPNPFYNTPGYNTDLDITWSCGSQIFYHGILQRNHRKMTIKWSFSYNSFVKHDSLTAQSIPMDPKQSIIKGLHCISLRC